jgi:hypothetical protein
MDPLFVANQGKLVAMVEPSAAGATLAAMRSAPYGGDAGIPGRVVEAHPRMAILKTEKGGSRILDQPILLRLPLQRSIKSTHPCPKAGPAWMFQTGDYENGLQATPIVVERCYI